jgi:hypothetical protein
MLLFVIIFNLLLALLNLYLVVYLWRLRHVLARVTRILNRVERRLHSIFYPAPEIVLKGQHGAQSLKDRYQRLMGQLRYLEEILLLFGFGLRLWKRAAMRK